MDWIMNYYSTFNSLRLVKTRLVIRLEKELPDNLITELTTRFRDLIKSGRISKTIALPEESDEPWLASKPRITFSYNNSSPGRLNQMILEINRLGKVASY